MASTAAAEKPGVAALRRKYVKQYGKRLFRAIDGYLAAQSLAPNEPVLDNALFPWAPELERNWDAIRAELMEVLKRREELPFFQDISPDQMRISPDDKWRTFFLFGFGYRSEQNCAVCPRTAALLEKIPGLETAFFSILAPGKIIPLHRGVTKGLIRGHLGLVVPPEPDRCFMDVGGVRCTWEEGRLLVFDDTFPHAVSNLTDHERVVLLFDFPRPLTPPARLLRRALFWGFRRTAYVREAVRNEQRWEEAQRLRGWAPPPPG